MTFDRYLKFVIVAVQWTIKYKCNRLAVLPLGEMEARSTEISILQYVPMFYQYLAPDPMPSALSLCGQICAYEKLGEKREKINACL